MERAAAAALLDGEGGPWRIRSGALIYRDAPLEKQGALGSLIKRIIGNPVTHTYRAVLESKRTRKRIEGIFEVTNFTK